MTNYEKQVLAKRTEEQQLEVFKAKKKRITAILQSVLSTPNGKKLFKVIMDLQPVDSEVFSSDERQTAYLLGRRSITLDLMNLVKVEIGTDILRAIDNEEI